MEQPNEFGSIRFELRIPKARVAILIGTGGEIKKRIETETKSKLEIDSAEGDVIITSSDVIVGYVAKDVVRAIGRGFNPDIAMYLLKSDYSLEVIDLSEGSKSKKAMMRVKGRVIGQEGRSRSIIENTLEVHVSVQGKTISVIGTIPRVMAAKHALTMLIEGAPHSAVFRWMESKRKSLMEAEMGQDLQVKDSFKKYMK